MADSQDKLTPSNQKSDQKKLQELEQQLAKDKSASDSANTTDATKDISSAKKSSESQHKATSQGSSIPPSSRRPPTPSSKTGMLWFVTLVNILLLLAIIGAGYWWWLHWQNQSQQQSELFTKQLAEQQNSVQQQQQKITQSIASNQLNEEQLTKQNQALQISIQNLIEQLQITTNLAQTNQNKLADVSGRRPADWLLAEADYLVRMAGRKLWLEHDVKTAVMMLQSADSRIQDLDDPSLLPVREKLTSDIQNLQQINQVSTQTIALALGAMLKQVDNLPLAFFKRPEQETIEQGVTDSIDDWRSNLAHNWQTFTENFFSFKKVETEIKPFMSEQQQWLSKEQLKFAILQAQVAVLQENSSLYQQSLQTAFGLLIEYFDTEKELVVQFTASLGNLQTTDFERTYPTQFDVAPMLKDVIEQRLDSRFVNGSN